MKYILILVWVGFAALLSTQRQYKQIESIDDREQVRYKKSFALIVFLPIILWAAFRSRYGYVDTSAYIYQYNSWPSTLSGLIAYIPRVEKDVGFTIFGGTIKLIFGSGFRPFLVIIAFIQGCIVLEFFRKYSSNYIISVFLFVAAGEYLAWMMNGIRQFLAVVFILAAFPLLQKKRFIPFILVVLFASTFHQSALIMIPIAFIVHGKPWGKLTLLYILAVIVIVLATDRFTDLLDTMLAETQYAANIDEIRKQQGVTVPRVLVYSVPAIIAFLGRKRLEACGDELINICINMSILSAAMYVVGMVTSGIMFGRLPIYVSLFSYILLPYEIDAVFTRRSARDVKIAMVIFYLAYYYYMIHFAYGRI